MKFHKYTHNIALINFVCSIHACVAVMMQSKHTKATVLSHVSKTHESWVKKVVKAKMAAKKWSQTF